MKLRIKESSVNPLNTVNENIIAVLNSIEGKLNNIEFDTVQIDDGYLEVKAMNTETDQSCSYVMDIYRGELNVTCDWSEDRKSVV